MTFLRSAAVASASFIVVTVGCLVSQPVASQPAPAQEQLVDAAGNMHIPKNYRTTYEFLGSWSSQVTKALSKFTSSTLRPELRQAIAQRANFPKVRSW